METGLTGLITLTTDFGLRDPFVGIMKGIILSINPEARVVDLTHQVESFDVMDGALALVQSYPYFPTGAIHVVVATPTYRFVGPDNGVFSLVYEREASFEVRDITVERYFRKPVSQTFHGRDIFAPIAAWLSKGLAPEALGSLITDYVCVAVAKPERVSPNLTRGEVLRVDKFGNLITNLTAGHLQHEGSFRILINQIRVTQLVSSYAEGRGNGVIAIVGSAGLVEIAAYQASAAERLGAGKGTEIILETQ